MTLSRVITLSAAIHVCLVISRWNLAAQAAAVDNSDADFGSYLEVYPQPVNISQSQLSCVPSGNRKCPLYIALMVSFGSEYDSRGVIPGVQLALDQINANPDLLPGYSLHYTLTDSQVDH